MPRNAIQVDAVSKRFRKGELEDSLRDLIPAMLGRLVGRVPPPSVQDFWALQDVSFAVPHGQSLGVIGPNGAGKSTLFKLMSRIIRPTTGSIAIDGRLSALIEVGAGFHHDLTGRENIYLNGAILGMKRAEIRGKEDAIIDFSGVRDFIDTPVKRYSSGMKARLGFAVAAHLQPDILLVDEVLSVGDARFRAKCIRHMHDLLRSGITVLFISHILDQVRALCPNTMVLDLGKVVYLGDSDGAIRMYLDLLGRDEAPNGAGGRAGAVEVRNVRLTDEAGREVLEWTVGKPGAMEMEVVLNKAVTAPSVVLNFSSLGGSYLGTATSSRQGLRLPGEPGTYAVRFALDPMPLAEGDFSLEIQVFGQVREERECLFATRTPRTVSVRGGDGAAGSVHFHGQWSRPDVEAAPHGAASAAARPPA